VSIFFAARASAWPRADLLVASAPPDSAFPPRIVARTTRPVLTALRNVNSPTSAKRAATAGLEKRARPRAAHCPVLFVSVRRGMPRAECSTSRGRTCPLAMSVAGATRCAPPSGNPCNRNCGMAEPLGCSIPRGNPLFTPKNPALPFRLSRPKKRQVIFPKTARITGRDQEVRGQGQPNTPFSSRLADGADYRTMITVPNICSGGSPAGPRSIRFQPESAPPIMMS
jgi:hypothetical protein